MTSPGAVVTHASGHLIHGGKSFISAAITNNSVIRADQSAENLYVNTYDITNNNSLEATNNATLFISGITIDQRNSGRLFADNAQIYFQAGVLVRGGTFETDNGGYIYCSGNTKGHDRRYHQLRRFTVPRWSRIGSHRIDLNEQWNNHFIVWRNIWSGCSKV